MRKITLQQFSNPFFLGKTLITAHIIMNHSSPLRTAFTALCGVDRPVMNQPLPSLTTPALVAAVSEAGGLGVIPAGRMSPAQISAYCRAVREKTARPFAIALDVDETPRSLAGVDALLDELSFLLEELDLPASVQADSGNVLGLQESSTYQERFEAALSEKPAAMIAMHGGFREPEAEALQAAGVVNMGFCTSLKEAKVLRSAECQVLIAQGSESAGVRLHFEESAHPGAGLMTLVPVLSQVTGLPVIACGGIYCREQVEALSVLGAGGVMLGTALAACKESWADEQTRYWALNGQMQDTVVCTTYSPAGTRCLKNNFTGWYWEGEPIERGAYEALFQAICAAAVRKNRPDLVLRELGLGIGRARFSTVAEALEKLSLSGC